MRILTLLFLLINEMYFFNTQIENNLNNIIVKIRNTNDINNKKKTFRGKMKFNKKATNEKSPAPGEEPEAPWTFLDTNKWYKICAEGKQQSPIAFTGSRSEVSQDIHFFDLFPSPKPMPTKFELLDEGRILAAKGEFMNFYTRRNEPKIKSDGPIERVYRTYRMEIKLPCEHVTTNLCDLELQFWANEEIDYTKANPIEIRNQAVFSLLFTK